MRDGAAAVAREKTGRVINLANRKQNESKIHSWEETGSGGRIYRLKIAGRLGWTAFYLKEVDSLENTIRFGRKFTMKGMSCGKSTKNFQLTWGTANFKVHL